MRIQAKKQVQNLKIQSLLLRSPEFSGEILHTHALHNNRKYPIYITIYHFSLDFNKNYIILKCRCYIDDTYPEIRYNDENCCMDCISSGCYSCSY